MEFGAIFGVVFLLTQTQATQMCTSVDKLNAVQAGQMLPDSQVLTLTTNGIMICAKACLTRSRCQSFNFNTLTGECQLNNRTAISTSPELVAHAEFVFISISDWPDTLAGSCAGHACSPNSYCVPEDETTHSCVASCLGTPTVDNGRLNETPGESAVGTILSHTCDPGYIATNVVECKSDGTWISNVCTSASSCNIVKQYQPDSEDGEYWLRLINFGYYTTRIYCYNMTTAFPQEFLTLTNINYGFYPMVWNPSCSGESALAGGCTGQGGEIWYSKISIDLSSMTVAQTDLTFANYTNNAKYLDFGTAYDCYVGHPLNEIKCGVKGHFIIDLRGTGWRVRDDQVWYSHGWEAMILSINTQFNNALIELYCGGYGGGCRATNGLVLVPYPEDAPAVPTV